MSNTLYISVGEFLPLDRTYTNPAPITVLASDLERTTYMSFIDVDQMRGIFPTKEDLITCVLSLDTFEGGVLFNEDGTYEFDTIGSIIVQGFPE